MSLFSPLVIFLLQIGCSSPCMVHDYFLPSPVCLTGSSTPRKGQAPGICYLYCFWNLLLDWNCLQSVYMNSYCLMVQYETTLKQLGLLHFSWVLILLCFYRRCLGKLSSTCYVIWDFRSDPAVSEACASHLRLVLIWFTAGVFTILTRTFPRLHSLYFFYISISERCLLQTSYDIKFLLSWTNDIT